MFPLFSSYVIDAYLFILCLGPDNITVEEIICTSVLRLGKRAIFQIAKG